MASDSLRNSNQDFVAELAKNLVAGLAVSFVAISLGAAVAILFAVQGAATAAVGLVGNISRAQATIRSVLIRSERATWRPASPSVCVLVLVEILISHAHTAQFAGGPLQ